MNNDRLHKLAEGYWSTTLSAQEEQELRELLSAAAGPLDEELEALRSMFIGFGALSREFEQIDAKPIAPKTARTKIVRLAIGFSAAAALAIGLFVLLDSHTTAPEPEVLCYINGEPITDLDVAMEQTKYLAQLSKLNKPIDILKSLKNK